jgi:hypothetical protein
MVERARKELNELHELKHHVSWEKDAIVRTNAELKSQVENNLLAKTEMHLQMTAMKDQLGEQKAKNQKSQQLIEDSENQGYF